MTTTCTLGYADFTLEQDWTVGSSFAYGEAAVDLPDAPTYAALSTEAKGKKNDAFRQREAFYRVFSAFKIPVDWDGETGDGGAAAHNPALPILALGGSIVGGLPLHVPGLRLLNHTRLKRGWDYSTPGTPVSTTPDDSKHDYMPAFAMFRVSTSPDKYQFCDKMNDADFSEGTLESKPKLHGYSLRMQHSVPGILVQSGLPHTAALNHFGGAEPTGVPPEVDYETLRVTVSIEADTYCEYKHPADADLPSGKPLQPLVIYLGDAWRLDFLAHNTVLDLNNGTPVLASAAAVLRDDRKALGNYAVSAYEWYRAVRTPIQVTFDDFMDVFDLGMMLTTMGSGTTIKTLNTVVSIITYDLTRGTTTIQTNDGEMDLREVAG